MRTIPVFEDQLKILASLCGPCRRWSSEICATYIWRGVSEDDPRWVDVQKFVVATCKTTDEAATQLLNTRPTTLAGVVAVLRYAYDYERRGMLFPGGHDDGDLSQCPFGGGVVGLFPPQSRRGDRDHHGPRGLGFGLNMVAFHPR